MTGLVSPRAWNKIWLYRGTFLLGLLNTLKTALVALLIALTLGIIFGLMATSGKKVLKAISRVYVEAAIYIKHCFLGGAFYIMHLHFPDIARELS